MKKWAVELTPSGRDLGLGGRVDGGEGGGKVGITPRLS